jgi:hypothetical protein
MRVLPAGPIPGSIVVQAAVAGRRAAVVREVLAATAVAW